MILGIYECPDAHIDPDTGISAWLRFRFYEDGTVIAVFSAGTPEEIASWFNKDDFRFQTYGRGTYKVNSNRVELVVQGVRDIIASYKGEINGDSLYLDVHSTYNDRTKKEVYNLV